MDLIKVKLLDGTKTVAKGQTIQEILAAWPGQSHPRIVAAKVNNDLRELSYRLEKDVELTPVYLSSTDGIRIYRRTLKMVFIRAAKEIFPDCRV
ncbi:MAG TPA: AAA family ATPase, partial [Firmicutes bacterium]|nr:AAA family ATPase [Bacillota bacterium]